MFNFPIISSILSWTTPVYGSTEDTQALMYEFNLGDNEYLTSVEIDYSAVLMSIRFESNIGRTASFGTRGGTSYKFSSFRSSAIIAFYGNFGIWGPHNINHIHCLGVMTQEIHPVKFFFSCCFRPLDTELCI